MTIDTAATCCYDNWYTTCCWYYNMVMLYYNYMDYNYKLMENLVTLTHEDPRVRVWRAFILLMRAKRFGPSCVNFLTHVKPLQKHVQSTLYNVHY